jgi:hypothetical protein
MFDSCDPMLEARLAESVEAMMSCLHEPDTDEINEKQTPHHIEIRVEKVEASELQKLPQWMPNEIAKLDLDSGLTAEYLSLLVDSCTTGDAPTQIAARALLRRDFGVESQADLQTTTTALLECLHELIGESTNDDISEEQLAELCGAIAASIIDDSIYQRSAS